MPLSFVRSASVKAFVFDSPGRQSHNFVLASIVVEEATAVVEEANVVVEEATDRA